MAAIHMTRIGAFGAAPLWLAANGCNVNRYLADFGLAAEKMVNPDDLIPLELSGEFVEEIERREGIDCFGLEVGQQAGVQDFGLYGKVLMQSLTLGGQLRKAVKNAPLLCPGFKPWLEPSPHDPDCVRFNSAIEMESGKVVSNEYSLQIFINLVRLAAGPEWRPKRVSLHSAVRNPSRFESLSDARIELNTKYTSFDIPKRLLQAPVSASRNSGAKDALTINELEVGAPAMDLLNSVRQTIQAGFGSRTPGIDSVAEMARISVSTLQRHLKAEGVTFAGLVDQARFEEARMILLQENRSVEEIARHLGYTKGTNFANAFHRWTGESPSHYRKARSNAE
jgi:AraC-like DNA-binding protein